MSLLDAEQSARYIESLTASVQALEADLAATRDKLRQAEARALVAEQHVAIHLGELHKWEEREAACCPEDVGFPEYITQAQARIAALEQRATLAETTAADAKAQNERLVKRLNHWQQCPKHGDPLVCLACEAEEDARPEWNKHE